MKNVRIFVEQLLNKKSLVKNLKKVDKRHLTCVDWGNYLKSNFQKLSNDHLNLSLSLSWFDSSAEIHFAKAHKAAYEFYMCSMNEVIF
jgi:hypothetical protein